MTTERIKRPLDECKCDWCGIPVTLGQRVYVDLAQGTAYCSASCAEAEDLATRKWTVEEIQAREG